VAGHLSTWPGTLKNAEAVAFAWIIEARLSSIKQIFRLVRGQE
jgi:hypothetical protein